MNKQLDNGTFIEDCVLHVNLLLLENSISIVYVIYNPKVDRTVPMSTSGTIQTTTGAGTITFIGGSREGAVFRV